MFEKEELLLKRIIVGKKKPRQMTRLSRVLQST
jgi:hypothetical protein